MNNLETLKKGVEVPKYVVVILAAIAIFLVGFVFGQKFEKNRIFHLQEWDRNYQDNFFPDMRKGYPAPLPPDRPRSPLSEIKAHGLIGKVLNVSEKKLTVEGDDKIEESVIVNDKTVIRIDGSPASFEDLKVDQRVAIFGQPDNQGQIAANFIRIFKDNDEK